MKQKCITKKELTTMSAAEFQNITENYDEIRLSDSPYTLEHDLINENESMSDFKEKLDLYIDYYIRRGMRKEKALAKFLGVACFVLEPKTTKYLLEKGCKVDSKNYDIPIDSPLFMAFTHNTFWINRIEMSPSGEKRLMEIGKLLIQYGSLLEITVHRYDKQTINIIDGIGFGDEKKFIDYFQSCQHLFNPVQKKQWGKLRLSRIF